MTTNNMKDTVELNASSRSAWRNPFGIALVVYYLVMAVVGLLIPDDILNANAGAREFSDFMASIVPQIDRITAINIKPDVNRFYFSVLWAGSPVLFVIACQAIWSSRHSPNATMWTMPIAKASAFILILSLVVMSSQYCYWIGDESNRQLRLLLANDLGRDLLGSVVYVHGPLLCLSQAALWFFGWVSGYIPFAINQQKKR